MWHKHFFSLILPSECAHFDQHCCVSVCQYNIYMKIYVHTTALASLIITLKILTKIQYCASLILNSHSRKGTGITYNNNNIL